MTYKHEAIMQKYIMTWRIIQPARVQDAIKAYGDIWDEDISDFVKDLLYQAHHAMRKAGTLKTIRRGTYILSKEGMELAAKFAPKERLLDNARLFLMKRQRKNYRKYARRLG